MTPEEALGRMLIKGHIDPIIGPDPLSEIQWPENLLRVYLAMQAVSYFYSDLGVWVPLELDDVCKELERRGQLTAVGGPSFIASLLDEVPHDAVL